MTQRGPRVTMRGQPPRRGGESSVFAGRYDHALDEKGRTMMPKRFRDRLAASQDRSIWITNALAGAGRQHL